MFNSIEDKEKTKREVRWWMKEFYRPQMRYGNRPMRDVTSELVEDTVQYFMGM
jgi:hypothetical protein